MAVKFYDQPKDKRDRLVAEMLRNIQAGLVQQEPRRLYAYAASPDTHVRKWAYISLGRIYAEQDQLRKQILSTLSDMLANPNAKVRQTAIYAAGEIGDLPVVADLLERGLHDAHHSVRNGVIGALKVMGAKHPAPTLAFARKHLKDQDPEVRRQVVHGIELRGRTQPQEVLPLLREMQHETNTRVRKMVVHVLSQISYKPHCLETVIPELRRWDNQTLVKSAVVAILAVHQEQKYCAHSYQEAKTYIQKVLGFSDDAEE